MKMWKGMDVSYIVRMIRKISSLYRVSKKNVVRGMEMPHFIIDRAQCKNFEEIWKIQIDCVLGGGIQF